MDLGHDWSCAAHQDGECRDSGTRCTVCAGLLLGPLVQGPGLPSEACHQTGVRCWWSKEGRVRLSLVVQDDLLQQGCAHRPGEPGRLGIGRDVRAPDEMPVSWRVGLAAHSSELTLHSSHANSYLHRVT